MVHFVRLGDQRRNVFEHGEEAVFLPVGVVGEDLVEEPETFHRRFESWGPTSRGERCSVDGSHVGSEGIVDREHPIDRTNHGSPLSGRRRE